MEAYLKLFFLVFVIKMATVRSFEYHLHMYYQGNNDVTFYQDKIFMKVQMINIGCAFYSFLVWQNTVGSILV